MNENRENGISLSEKITAIQAGLHAPKDKRNEFGNYTYRSAESIYEAVKPLLKEQGCSVTIMDELVMVGDRYYVKAIATISDGVEARSVCAFAREQESKKGMDEAQVTGSASSYARKYALGGLFLIDDNKDPDMMDNRDEGKPKIDPKEVTKSAPRKAPKPECPEDVWYKLVKMEVEGRRYKGMSGLQCLAQNYHTDEATLLKFNSDVQMSRDAVEANAKK